MTARGLAATLCIVVANAGCSREHHHATRRAHTPAAAQSPSNPSKTPARATTRGDTAPAVDDARVALGRRIFFDASLSDPPGTSCASCHDPAHGYAGNHGSTNGVPLGSRAGHFARRSTPSVLYLRFVRRFHVKWDDEDGEDGEAPEAYGGFFWDGRASTLHDVAPQPLLNRDEMGNRDRREIADKLAKSAYADALRREFDGVFDTADNAVEALGFCIEAFLTSPAMSPFSSKYDEVVRGRETLTPLEARGLDAFRDFARGGCAGCHRLDPSSPLPEASLFTDFGYEVVAVPRNRRLPSNADARKFDLGVCERRDPRRHTEDPWFCGAFRTPSLRNVAARESFMHNGVFASLRDVVRFYSTRATNPERWYEGAAFDDLPAKYRANVNEKLPPYQRPRGEAPVLSDDDIDAIVAFLGTLTDRRVPGAPELAER